MFGNYFMEKIKSGVRERGKFDSQNNFNVNWIRVIQSRLYTDHCYWMCSTNCENSISQKRWKNNTRNMILWMFFANLFAFFFFEDWFRIFQSSMECLIFAKNYHVNNMNWLSQLPIGNAVHIHYISVFFHTGFSSTRFFPFNSIVKLFCFSSALFLLCANTYTVGIYPPWCVLL